MIPLDRIRELAKERGYGFNQYKPPLGELTRVVLVGERHAVHPDYTFQGSLIELLEPRIVLHEFYEQNGTPSKSETVRMAVEWIDRWKSKYDVQLKPCDLPNHKVRQFHQLFYDLVRELSEFDDEPDLNSIIVDDSAIRELVMGKLIRAEAVRTNKPLIAIVGGYHARPESRIHEELRTQRAIEIGGKMPIGYVTINQDDRLKDILQKGAIFFE